MRIYISSTSKDLFDYRAAVISKLRKAGLNPVCMEDYPAQDMLPVDKCLRDVASCDFYVGIFAWRYGFIPPGHSQSITELEYRKAVEVGIQTLIYMPEESLQWPAEYIDSGMDAEKIKNLRQELALSKMLGFFKSPDDLASGVLSSLFPRVMEKRFAEVNTPTDVQQTSVQQAIALFQEGLRQQAERARQISREPIPISLPRLRGTFVDREKEQENILEWLRMDDLHLVVIVAPGGYGKTELMTKVIKAIAPGTSITVEDVQGLLYVRCLHGDVTLGSIFEDAGRIVGKRDEFRETYAAKELTLARKLEYFFRELSRAGNVWVVLDNFEDLLAEDDTIVDPEIREFLETANAVEHTVRVIATTRAIPRLGASRKIKKLDLSSGLPEEAAIRFLQEEGADYGLADCDETILLQFVRRVHCIPKALESVLGYLEEHYPDIQLSHLLSDEHLFADFDRHDMENGLKKLVAEQFNDQSPDAKLVLYVLSIFPKPAPQAALRYILPGIESTELAALLTRLEKNRLIKRQGDAYDLHPIVRSFVIDQVPKDDAHDTESPEQRKKEVLLTFTHLHTRAAGFFKELRKPKAEWKTIGDLEPHIQEIHHLICAKRYDDAAQVLGIIDSNYLRLWGYYHLVIELREKLMGRIEDPDLKSQNIGNLGLAYMLTGNVKKSILLMEEALAIEREIGDKNGEEIWLGNLGTAYSKLGEVRKAIEYYEKALTIAREISNKKGEGTWLGNLGSAYSKLGEVRKAIEYYEEALAIEREIGDKNGEEIWLGNLGTAYSKLGEAMKAIEYYEKALTIAREISDKNGEGTCLGNLGTAYSNLGEVRKAIEYHEKALTIAREIGDKNGEETWLECLAVAFRNLGETAKAALYYNEALEIAHKTENAYSEGSVISNIGELAIDEGNFDQAILHYRQALEIAEATENRTGISYRLNGVALANHHLGNLTEAREHYEKALSLEIPETNFECAALLGILCLEEGNAEKAMDLFSRGISLCNETLKKTPDLYERHYMRALAHLGSGQPGEAHNAYQRAMEISKEKGVVKTALQRLSLLERAAPACAGIAEARIMLDEALCTV